MPQQPIDPNDVIPDTPAGKPIDPSDVIQDQPQQAGLFTRMGRALETPFAEMIPGAKAALEKFAQPGLDTSPNMARLKGFLSGSAEAVTPALVAGAATLGTGAPAVIGNTLLATQGIGQATDPSLSPFQRIAGGLTGVAGGAGALGGLSKVLNAGKAAAEAVEAIPKNYTVEPTLQPGGPMKTREPWSIKTSGQPIPVPAADVIQDATPHISYPEQTPYNPIEPNVPNTGGASPTTAGPSQESQDAWTRLTRVPEPEAPNPFDKYAPNIAGTPDQGIPQEPLPTPTPIDRYAPNVGAEPLPYGFRKAGTLADVPYTNDPAPYTELDTEPPYVAPAFRNGGQPLRQDIADAVQQAQAPEPELPESWKPFAQETNEARADAATMGHPSEPISPEAQQQGVEPITPAEEQPGSTKLLQILKNRPNAIGQAYEAAQAEGANPLAVRQLGLGVQKEAAMVGQPTKKNFRVGALDRFLQNKVSPEIQASAGATPPTPNAPDVAAATTPEAKQSLLDSLLQGSEKGAISSPLLARILGTGTGAVVGAPIGASYDEDDPTMGALKGALAGGLIGGWITPTEGGGLQEAANNFLNTRSASMLAGPSPVLKKALADPGGQINEALLKLLTPGERQTGVNMLKELPFLHPGQFIQDLKEGALSGDDKLGAGIGGVVEDIQHAQSGPLGLAGVPFKAIMNAYVKAMMRAGLSEEEAMKVVGSGVPETQTGQDWMRLHRNPLVRYLVPFAKLGTSMAEGARNIPGISLMAGNPENALQRTAVGGLNMALGGLNELYSQNAEEEGEPLSPLAQGAMAAAVGPKWVAPYAAGKALTSLATQSPATALTELLRLIPGSTALLPTRHAGESTDDYSKRVITNVFGQFVPTMLEPGSGSTR